MFLYPDASKKKKKKDCLGTSLAVQWLRLRIATAVGQGFDP